MGRRFPAANNNASKPRDYFPSPGLLAVFAPESGQ